MKKYLLFFALGFIFFSCKHKKATVGGSEEIIDVHEFIDIFSVAKLPFQFSDSLFKHHAGDSLIPYKTVIQFIPDTVFSVHFGKAAKPRIYALGKIPVKKNETYLFIKAVTPVKKLIYILCFDKTNKFVASLPVINTEGDPSVSWNAVMDNKYTISIIRQRKSPDGLLFYKKWVYVFNDAGVFTLILTESNEAKPKNVQVINPIDDLPRKYKFSGDYIQDKRNFISVRDGKNNSYVVIFVHFEKDDGECKGELKGQAKIISASMAQYRSNGDPCIIDFSFNGNALRMKEVEACGNHRDIKCFFDGSYFRQKETKSKPVKKKK